MLKIELKPLELNLKLKSESSNFRLSFVKSLKVANGSAITSICCSKTSGDIVVVAHQGNGSRVEMYTVGEKR